MQEPTVGLCLMAYAVSGTPRQFILCTRARRLYERRAVREVLLADVQGPDDALMPRHNAYPALRRDYTSLKYLAQLPPARWPALRQGRRQKFKEVLGTRCASGATFQFAARYRHPAAGQDDVKRLIDLFGDTGALIIDGPGASPTMQAGNVEHSTRL